MAKNKKNDVFNILIVDDVPDNIQILGNILKSRYKNISYALSGKEALTMSGKNDFDLILLDIMMPEINGFEVCEELRKRNETKDIPIIFLTAKAEHESIVRGFKIGAQDYITKPFNSEELLARVETHLKLRHQRKQLDNMNKTLERKVAERTRQLQKANRQLVTLEKAKSDFLNIISHELRTPLNGLQGLIELLRESEKTVEQGEYIEYLKETSDRLAKFSETAILITTLSADKYEASYSPQRISYIFDNVIETYEKLAKEKDIKIIRNIQPNDLEILIDYDLIKKSLENLLDNAIRFSPEDSTVEVKAYLHNDKPVIEVNDEGPGFSEEIKEKLFEYFTSGDVMNSEGLGLSIPAVKLIMDAHNGEVKITNRKNGGASIKMIFKAE